MMQEIRGDGSEVKEVVINSNGDLKTLKTDAVIPAIGRMPNSDLVRGQVKLDKANHILMTTPTMLMTDINGQTIARAYAVGDVIFDGVNPTPGQAAIAAGDGMKAAYAILNDFKKSKIGGEFANASLRYDPEEKLASSKRGKGWRRFFKRGD